MITLCGIIVLVSQCTSDRELRKEVNQDQEKNYIPGEVLVRFKKDIIEEKINKIADRMDMKRIKTISTPNYPIYRFKLPDGLKVEEAIKSLEKLHEVEHVQPNFTYRLF